MKHSSLGAVIAVVMMAGTLASVDAKATNYNYYYSVNPTTYPNSSRSVEGQMGGFIQLTFASTDGSQGIDIIYYPSSTGFDAVASMLVATPIGAYALNNPIPGTSTFLIACQTPVTSSSGWTYYNAGPGQNCTLQLVTQNHQ